VPRRSFAAALLVVALAGCGGGSTPANPPEAAVLVTTDCGAKVVNGKPADKGAAEVKLSAGDVEWWDLHNWEKECASVPADAQ
jgi:hypothetical protein